MTWKRRDFIKATAATLALGAHRAFPYGALTSADSDIAATTRQVYDPNAAEIGIGSPLCDFDPLKWLYIGCEGDHPRSWTFMGGGLAPGQLTRTIQYAVSVGNRTYCPDEASPTRKLDIKWYLRDGYLPCPVTWEGR